MIMLLTSPHPPLPKEQPVRFKSTQAQLADWMRQSYPHTFTLTKIGNSNHLRCLKGGFEIQFKSEELETAFVYFRTPKFSCFQDPVWLGIHKGWTIKAAVCYLGEPAVKNRKLTEMIYPHLGLGIVFAGPWSNQSSLAEYCYIFKRENDAICGGCGKSIKKVMFKCACEIVSYCRQDCYKRHYGHHLIFCDDGYPL